MNDCKSEYDADCDCDCDCAHRHVVLVFAHEAFQTQEHIGMHAHGFDSKQMQ